MQQFSGICRNFHEVSNMSTGAHLSLLQFLHKVPYMSFSHCHLVAKFRDRNDFEPNLPLKTGCNKFQMESVKMKKATKTVAFRQLLMYCNIVDNQLLTDAKMLVICMSVSWVVLEWYLSHDFIVGNKSLSNCKSVYYMLYKCCFLLFSQVTYQYIFVICLIVR